MTAIIGGCFLHLTGEINSVPKSQKKFNFEKLRKKGGIFTGVNVVLEVRSGSELPHSAQSHLSKSRIQNRGDSKLLTLYHISF